MSEAKVFGRTGTADPLTVLGLLWQPRGNQGRSGVDVAAVTAHAVALADETGLEQLSMRRLAARVGVGTMSLYSYVPGKAELVDLMVDRCFGDVEYDSQELSGDWRGALERVVRQNVALYDAHPWLLDIDTSRPPLGPGTLGKYDTELAPLAATPLTDVEVDQVLTVVLDFARAEARRLRHVRSAVTTPDGDVQWWEVAGPQLAALVDLSRYPHAARVGAAAGQEYGAAVDLERSHSFGLEVILDGIERRIQAA